MENLVYIFLLILLLIACSGWGLSTFFFKKKLKLFDKVNGEYASKYYTSEDALRFEKIKSENLSKEISTLKEELEILKKKYELNPSYESQLMLAELLSGNGLFKIERIETQNLFHWRR